jgi:Flp pilus assembly protein TadD
VDSLLKGLLETEQARSETKQDDNIDELLDSLVLASEETFDCPMCGKHVPPGSESCPDCGSEFVEKQIEVEKPADEMFALDLESELDKLSDELEEMPSEAPPVPTPSIKRQQPPMKAPTPEVVAEASIEAVERGIASEPEAPAPRAERPTSRMRAPEPEATVELETAEGDIPKVHIFGSRYVDFVVIGSIGAIVAVFVLRGMHSWQNFNVANVGLLVGVAASGMVASFALFRISVSAVAEGDRLFRTGKFKDALEQYERAIRIDSRPSAAWTSKGVALKRLERYGEALRAHNMALELDPKNEIALCNKGDLLFRVGKTDEAIECYEAALKIRPGYAVAWNNKAIALARRGDLGEAKLCEDEALRIRPKYATAWVNKGRILVQLGLKDEASKCLKRARALSAKA